MKINIKMNHAMMRKLSNAQIQAAEKTTEAVKTEVISHNVMPFDSGTMQNESMAINTKERAKGHFSISVNTPYARRLYFHPEYNFQTVNNPNAQGKWFEPWISGKYKKFAGKTFKELFKREAGL